jgi:hypothetical protein
MPGLPHYELSPDAERRLTAIRNKRHLVLHRDSEGVEDIADDDLDATLSVLNSIARAPAFVTHSPLSHDRDGRERDSFIAESLVRA